MQSLHYSHEEAEDKRWEVTCLGSYAGRKWVSESLESHSGLVRNMGYEAEQPTRGLWYSQRG